MRWKPRVGDDRATQWKNQALCSTEPAYQPGDPGAQAAMLAREKWTSSLLSHCCLALFCFVSIVAEPVC